MSNKHILIFWGVCALFGWFVLAPAHENAERQRIEAIVQEKCK